MSFLLNLLAQAAAAATPEAVAQAAPTQGVIAYPLEFFADSRPANAMEMVGRIPGFNFDGGNNVRGYEGAAGNVLIDGQRPASKSDGLEDILRRLPASKVARIELIRGGAPGIDMQGKSVIANIIQKEGGGFHGLMAVADQFVVDDGRNGPAVRLEASGGSQGRKWELGFFSGRGVNDGDGDGPHTQTRPTGTLLQGSLVQSQGDWSSVNFTGAYELPILGGALRMNGRFERNPFAYDETNRVSFPPPGFVARDHYTDDTDTGEVGLRFSRNLGPRTKLELVGLRQTKDEAFKEIYAEPGFSETFTQQTRTEETIGRAVLKFTQSPIFSWEVGGENVLNTLDNGIRDIRNGAQVVFPAASVQVEEKRWELFVKTVWQPSARWTFEGGLRQEGSTITSSGDVVLAKSLSFTKPRVAVSWSPTDNTQIRARYEREVGQLDFSDFTANSSISQGTLTAGNPNLNPGQAWVSEVTLEQRFWSAGSANMTVRHSTLTDVVDRAPVFTATRTFDAPANIGAGTKDELIASFTLPFDKLGMKGAQLRAESTWRKSEVTDPTTHTKREITRLPPQEWQAHFTWDMPQYRLNWGIDAFGGLREVSYQSDQISITKPKTYVIPFLEWKPQSDLSLRMELPNVTERGLRRTRYIYAGPRDRSTLSYVDDRDIQFGRMIKLRLRKTFG